MQVETNSQLSVIVHEVLYGQTTLTTIRHLVADVEKRDVLVDLDDVFGVGQKVEDVGDCGGHPTTSLVKELVEAFRASCEENINFLNCGPSPASFFTYLSLFR